jgi:hypothetical protein
MYFLFIRIWDAVYKLRIVTPVGVAWDRVMGFIEHLQNVTSKNYDSLSELHTP